MNDPHETDLAAAARGLLAGDDALARQLQRWAADAAVDEAARARLRAHWLRVQAEADASLVGTLVDLAERAVPVVVDVAGHRVRGLLAGIGADFVALRTDQGQEAIVVTDAVEAVRTEPGGVDVRGDRSSTLDVTLAGVLGPVAADRPTVLVRTRQGVVIRGELRSAGVDVVRVRTEGAPSTPTWVPIGSIALLVLEP